MKEFNVEILVEQYIKSGEILYHTTINQEYRKHSKEMDKLIKIYKYLEKNLELAKQAFPKMFENTNACVNTQSHAHTHRKIQT